MKIRTDFVTNSSSSSYTVWVSLETKNGGSCNLDLYPENDGFVSPYLNCDADEILHAGSVQELTDLLYAGVGASDGNDADALKTYQKQVASFSRQVQKKCQSINDIRHITFVQSWDAWGEYSSCLAWNDKRLKELSHAVVQASDAEKPRAIAALQKYLDEGPVFTVAECGDSWPTGFMGRSFPGHYVWHGTVEELALCVDMNKMNGDDNATERVEIDFATKTVSGEATFRLKATDLAAVKEKLYASSDGFVIEGNVLTKYAGHAADVAIPVGITKIGPSAFGGCTGLASVTIPASVTVIDREAFRGCTGLTSVTIPGIVAKIGLSAFEGCTGLTSVTIPASVTVIDSEAFRGCTGLTSVTIPARATKIGWSAFRGCTGLTSVTIPRRVAEIVPSAFEGCTGLTSVTIPANVTEIGNGAFRGCTGLTSVTIPASVTRIGSEAFRGCTGLKTVTFSEGMQELDADYSAFEGCTGLTSIAFPRGLRRIFGSTWSTSNHSGTFKGCTGLTSVTFPKGLRAINGCLFEDCTSLTDVTLPEELQVIGGAVFRGCASLKNVTIPASVTKIGGEAFKGCRALADAAGFVILNDRLFDYVGTCPDAVVPEGVRVISSGAFTGRWVKSVALPENLAAIQEDAFKGCRVKLRIPRRLLTGKHPLPLDLTNQQIESVDAEVTAALLAHQKEKTWQNWVDRNGCQDSAAVLECLIELAKKERLKGSSTVANLATYLHKRLAFLPTERVQWMLDYYQGYQGVSGNKLDALRSAVAAGQGSTGGTTTRNNATTGGNRCRGLIFVVTGALEHFKDRKAMQTYIEEQGGKLSGSVSVKTGYLVTNTPYSGTVKNRTAASLGVPIISEEEFIRKFGIDE